MLLKAIYSYESPFAECLKFQVDEVFLKIRSENEYWHLVAKKCGALGWVPKNFVKEVEDQDADCISFYARNALCSLKYSNANLKDKAGLLKLLRALAQEDDQDVLSEEGCSNSPTTAENGQNSENSKVVQAPFSPTTEQSTIHSKPSFSNSLATVLVDAIRLGTNANYADCFQTFRLLMTLLGCKIPDFQAYANRLALSILDQKEDLYRQDSDWYLLKNHFEYLNNRARRQQDPEGEYHDDQEQTERRLDDLNQLLQNASQGLVRFFFTSNKFEPLSCLIELYQYETALTIKRRLLLAIGICSSLDAMCTRVSLNSALPSELIREIGSVNSSSDVSHVAMCLRVLTMLLAQASELQVVVKSLLNVTFLSQVLNLVGPLQTTAYDVQSTELIQFDPFTSSSLSASTPDTALFQGRLAHAATILLLACNWHFCSISVKRQASKGDSTHIPLIEALLKNPNASQLFLELVVQAFNRDLDPIAHVNFKRSTNYARLDCLEKWKRLVVSDSTTVNNNNNFHRLPESQLSAIFQSINPVDLDRTSHAITEVDDGLYARVLWPSSLNKTTACSSDQIRLPTAVAVTTPCHSVLKLLCDVFSAHDSSELVYQNDRDVIIAVIARQLNNLRLSDSERVLDYCLLLGLIVAHTDYLQRGAYKGDELVSALDSLVNCESTDATASAPVRRGLEMARGTLNRLRSAMDK